jgi:uncharacterized coiled-coil protein SlyX
MDFGNAAQLGSFAVSLVTLVFVITIHRSKAANDRVSKIETKTEKLELRTSKLEGIVENLPDKASLHRMELAFEKMQGSMNVMAEKLKSVAATADRLQDFLESQAAAKPPRRRSGT